MNSLINYIDGHGIANEIRLSRNGFFGSYLLVEGLSDQKVMSNFCEKDVCKIIPCYSKSNLIDATNELERTKCSGIIALADRDYCDILGYPTVNGDVIYTDENDMELTILHSPALDECLKEFGSKDKIDKITKSKNYSVVELICESASVIGAIRLLSQLEKWNLIFNNLKLKYKKGNSFYLDKKKTVNYVLGKNQQWKIDIDIVMSKVNELMEKSVPLKNYCNGHDCIRILGKALCKEIGSKDSFKDDKGAENLESTLRLTYKFRHFKLTNMYRDLRKWEKSTGYSVLISIDSDSN